MIWLLLALAVLPDPKAVWTGSGATPLGAPSPDGRWVSGIDPATGDLLIHDVGSGADRRLTANTDKKQFAYFSVFSPDSKQVAYAWFNEEGFYDLRIVDLEGGKPRLVYRNEEAGFVQPCAFSPDSKQILTLLFRKDNISQIASIPLAGGAARVLKSLNWVYPKRMDFSPDGRWIVYDSFPADGARERDIFLLAADGSREKRLVEGPGDDLFPIFSPDGARVFFSSDRGGSPGIWSVAVEGGKPELVRNGLGRFLLMGLSHDGRIFFSRRNGSTGIYRAGVDLAAGKLTTGAERIGDGSSAAWSPDGGSIAWLGRQPGENYGVESRFVLIRRLRDESPRAIYPKLAHLQRLFWSVDGKALLVSGSDGKGRAGVFEVSPESGEVKVIAQEPGGPHTGYPACATVRGVAYAKERSVWIGDKTVRAAAEEVEAVALSADGQKWAVGTAKSLVIGERQSPTAQPVTALAWTPQGTAVVSVEGDELWLHRIDGTATRIAKAASAIDGVSIHPDGKSILFSAGRAVPEVWTLETTPR
ncbi:MAG: hypothetical protein U0Q16_30210 [Bryobacteraceae bacterium]